MVLLCMSRWQEAAEALRIVLGLFLSLENGSVAGCIEMMAGILGFTFFSSHSWLELASAVSRGCLVDECCSQRFPRPRAASAIFRQLL